MQAEAEAAQRSADYEAEKLRAKEQAAHEAAEEAARKAAEEAERKAREEAERKAREEAERKAREEAERKAREEAERKAREEAERRAAEEEAARRAQQEAEAKSSKQSKSSSSKSSSSKSSSSKSSSSKSSMSNAELRKAIAAYAQTFVGKLNYVWGGESLVTGADCSGFVQQIFKKYGISLPRVSSDQGKAGRKISAKDLQPGDLVHYDGHIAIYIGNGKVCHASSAKTGVKISKYNYRTICCCRNVID